MFSGSIQIFLLFVIIGFCILWIIIPAKRLCIVLFGRLVSLQLGVPEQGGIRGYMYLQFGSAMYARLMKSRLKVCKIKIPTTSPQNRKAVCLLRETSDKLTVIVHRNQRNIVYILSISFWQNIILFLTDEITLHVRAVTCSHFHSVENSEFLV